MVTAGRGRSGAGPGARLRAVTASRSLLLSRARREDLGAIRAFVGDAARSLGADDHAAADLVQAVDESATNVLRHGYRDAPGPLEVAVRRDGPDLVVALRDEAPSFDPTAHPTPDLEVPLTARAPGGLGIHLARACVDRVTHTGRAGTGNELVMVRHLQSSTREARA